MSKRPRTIVVSLALLIAVAAVAASVTRHLYHRKECISDAQCLRNMEVLMDSSVRMYADSRGQLPESLAVALADAGISNTTIFRHCAGTRGPVEADYTYVNWSRVARPPDLWCQEYPVLFDARDDYHKERGVFIYFTNMKTMWDPGAKWLKRFAAEHPEVVIQLPLESGSRAK